MGLVKWTYKVPCPWQSSLRMGAARHSKDCVQAHKECKLSTFLCQIESSLPVLALSGSQFPC